MLPLPSGFARRTKLLSLAAASPDTNLERLAAEGRSEATVLGYLRELRQMIVWCRSERVRISSECWETCILEFCIFKSLPDDTGKVSWSPTTFKENARKLRAAVVLLGLGVASKSADFESISKAIQGRNPSRVPEGNAAADGNLVLQRVKMEWQSGSVMTARLMLVGLLTMARPLDLQTLEWCCWKKGQREDGQPLLSMKISAKGVRLHTRELLWPQGPPGSAWRQLWEEVWRTTTQAEIGGAPESKASIAQWNAFKCSLRSIGIRRSRRPACWSIPAPCSPNGMATSLSAL